MAEMTREVIFDKVREVLIDALGVDEDEVTPEASIKQDLGAESIDFLDIHFRLRKAFKNEKGVHLDIPHGAIIPSDWHDFWGNFIFVQNGVLTLQGMQEFKRRAPFANFTEIERNPDMPLDAETVLNTVYTVEYLVRYMEDLLSQPNVNYKPL